MKDEIYAGFGFAASYNPDGALTLYGKATDTDKNLKAVRGRSVSFRIAAPDVKSVTMYAAHQLHAIYNGGRDVFLYRSMAEEKALAIAALRRFADELEAQA